MSQSAAIVGSGPAGREAARCLLATGWRVDVFEQRERAGGLVEYAIPLERMPGGTAERDAAVLAERGAVFHYHARLGDTLSLPQLEREHDAVILALGAELPKQLAAVAAVTDNVYQALAYLEAARANTALPTGRRVLVVGGGDTSLDAAVTAKMAGAEEVTVVYRGSRTTMPTQPHEQQLAEQRGVVVCERTELVSVTPGSPLRATLQCGTERTQHPFDTIIIAIGQQANRPLLDKLGLRAQPDGRTNRPRVFVAGDLAYGPDRLARAELHGRKVAALVIKQTAAA